MINLPKISIITPNYNGAAFLEKTICSVLSQNYPNLEYIIIDGGSTDESVSIIQKYTHKLHYWISEKDGGMYHAIQKGFEKSTGEIMAWLNSDDLYHSQALFTVAEIFQRFQNVEWITGIASNIDEADKIVKTYPLKKWSNYHFLAKEFGWIQQESTFWRRSIWDRAGGKMSEKMLFAGDFELWYRFFLKGKLYSVETILGGFRILPGLQKSSKYRDLYMKEIENYYQENLSNSIRNHTYTLNKIKFYSYILHKFRVIYIPFFKNRLDKIYDYPGIISFDVNSNSFVLYPN
jgi:glycosyltransferase involved in cell wall biosynthesis